MTTTPRASLPLANGSFLAPGGMFNLGPGSDLTRSFWLGLMESESAQLTIVRRLGFELTTFSLFLVLFAAPLANIMQSRKEKPDTPQRENDNEELGVG